MDSLKEYDKQRMQDMAWSHNETKNLADRTTAFDNDLKQDYRNMLEEESRIQQQTKKDLYALKTGTYSMTDTERQEFMEKRQEREQQIGEKWKKWGNAWDAATKTAEVVQKAADLGVDTLAVMTAPVGGQLIAYVYTGAKNIGGNVMDAAVNNKSIGGAIIKGMAQAGSDITQNHAGGKWARKPATYAGSEALKEGIVAAVDGENAVKATIKGELQGTFKYVVDETGGDSSTIAHHKNNAAMRGKYDRINNIWSKELSPKSIKTLNSMNSKNISQKSKLV